MARRKNLLMDFEKPAILNHGQERMLAVANFASARQAIWKNAVGIPFEETLT